MAETSNFIPSRRQASVAETLLDGIGSVDPFFKGIDIILAALNSEACAPKRENERLRAHFEAAAARFDNPIISTVLCIRPVGRPAVVA